MCNRYALSKKNERIIVREYGSLELYFMARFNIAPAQSAPVVLVADRRLVCREMTWGFKAPWGKNPLTNAQFETLDQKPSFKEAFAARRCLVPATGFYEWTNFGGKRQPVRFSMPTAPVFFFAGLWTPGAPGAQYLIITVPANEHVRPVHNRMPLIVQPKDYGAWLNPSLPGPKNLLPAADALKTVWVSDRLNNARNEEAELAKPLTGTVRAGRGGDPLPPGLPEGAEVTILGAEAGGFAVDFQGQVFSVPFAGVQRPGWEVPLL